MQIDKYLIAILVFGILIVGANLVINDIQTSYNTTITDDDFSTINAQANKILNDSYTISESAKDKTFGGEVTEVTAWESMLTGAYSAISLVSGSFILVGDVLNSVARKVGIPPIFIAAAITLMVISVIFGLIYLIFRFKG